MNKIKITPEFMADLKAKAEKATPGPWQASSCSICLPERNNEQEILGGFNDYDDEPNERFGFGYNNAEFVAAANPQVVLALIARIEELEADNYGPEILNDPQALTTAYFAGEMAAGRRRNIENDRLQAENARLEKEADWLATELEKRDHGCAWCSESCSQFVCGYKGPDNWRAGAKQAVSGDLNEGKN